MVDAHSSGRLEMRQWIDAGTIESRGVLGRENTSLAGQPGRATATSIKCTFGKVITSPEEEAELTFSNQQIGSFKDPKGRHKIRKMVFVSYQPD